MADKNLTAELLRELLFYDADTGIFTRRVRMSRGHPAGTIAGTTQRPNPDGVIICIKKQHYAAHRLAWLYMTGDWPTEFIDHIDGNACNNRFVNLRQATNSVNMQNQRRAHRDAESPYIGVSKSRGRWMARICVNQKTTYIGVYETEEQAYVAYVDAKRRLHVGGTL